MKIIKGIVVILVASSLFFACKDSGGDSGTTYTAPTVKSAAQLPSPNATAPADQTQAVAIFNEAMTSVGSAVNTNGTVSSIVKARATTTIPTETTTWSGSYGGGTVDFTTTSGGSSTMPDQGWTPVLGTTYNDLVAMVMHGSATGTLTGVTVPGVDSSGASNGFTYVVTGEMKMAMDMDVNVDYIYTATPSINLDYSLGLSFGVAMSVKRSDGVGAKFILTYGGTAGGANVDVSSLSGFGTDLLAQLNNTKATLKVYTTSDTTPATYQIGLDQLGMFNDFNSSNNT